jgi:hypothetical protein
LLRFLLINSIDNTADVKRAEGNPKKAPAFLCKRAILRLAFIDEQRLIWSVALLCRTMAVSRNGFYRWLHVLRHHQMPSGVPMR